MDRAIRLCGWVVAAGAALATLAGCTHGPAARAGSGSDTSAGASSGAATGETSGATGATSGTDSGATSGANSGTSGASKGAMNQDAAVTGSGCGKPAAPTGDFHLHTTDGNGVARDYEVMVPTTYDPNTPLALAFLYHGAGGTEASAVAFGLQRAPGAASSAIFVFPQGIPYQTYGVGWDDRCAGYDMVFFDKMLSELTASYCIDPKRVFAGGFSWGCDHTTALACCRGSRLRAVAAASCSDDFANAADYKTYINEPCPASGTTGIRFTFDPQGDPAYTAQNFKMTSALYESLNSCLATSAATAVTPCVSFQGCSKPLVECPYPGLGHGLPANWATDTWSFFSTFK